jgi:hypothetical protein
MTLFYGHTMTLVRTVEINVHLKLKPTEGEVEIVAAFDAETSDPVTMTESEIDAITDSALSDFHDTIESLKDEEAFDNWKTQNTFGKEE